MATKKKKAPTKGVGMDGYKAYNKLSDQSAKEGNARVEKLGKLIHAKSTSLADAKKLVEGAKRFLVNEYRNEQRNIEKTATRLNNIKRARSRNK